MEKSQSPIPRRGISFLPGKPSPPPAGAPPPGGEARGTESPLRLRRSPLRPLRGHLPQGGRQGALGSTQPQLGSPCGGAVSAAD